MVGQSEVTPGIVVADVADQITHEPLVVRELSVFDILPDGVAEKASEILVTREGKEGPGICEHPNKMR